MTELIITEKPQAALKIASALADKTPKKESINKVPYYRLTHNGKQIVVACAVGHLYSVAEKEKGKWTYPVFDVKWEQSSKVKKDSAFTSKYVDALKKLSKDADEFTVATDYDIEGEVIGLNVVRYICKKKDANRMKFSTLTKQDIVDSYEHKSKHLDWGQANAGETRHFLDWYNGINYSRALTNSIKAVGKFKLMSIGRVQGPALKIIVDREKEIKEFKSVPYWQIQLLGDVKDSKIEAWHIKDKFWDDKEAEDVMKKVKGQKKADVAEVSKNQFQQTPPPPFDLTTLQTESYRTLRISPKETLSIAQELYISGCISYPRTSSQKLPPAIGYKKILADLEKQSAYKELCADLLKKGKLNPREGAKTDPAHPAIFPTGLVDDLSGKNAKVYDLVVKRFLSCFAEPAIRETMEIKIDVKKEMFVSKGTRTIKKGWHKFYEPYLSLAEVELPPVEKGNVVDIDKIKKHSKETQPPKRYTPASIIRELEKKHLGTKSTRSEIIDTLFRRGYVNGTSIEATDLGIKTVETLKKYSPKIIDEKLTRKFEDEMEEVRTGHKKGEEILNDAKEVLINILTEFKSKEKKIGKELSEANVETMIKESTVGACHSCGGTLMIRRGKFGRFVACDKYPECKTTFKLPSSGLVKTSEKVCEKCSYPLIMIIRKARKPQELCINPECPSKKVDESQFKEKKCPKCKKGKLILRRSVYGTFIGCSNYPNCRYTQKIENGKK